MAKKKTHGSALAPGIMLFGAAQFLLCLVAAEALYPGYSTASNAISDLGVGSTSLLFNCSIALFGAASLAAAYLLKEKLGKLAWCMAIAGIGAFGVGLFPETLGWPHFISAFAAFFFGATAALLSSRREAAPLSCLFALLGIVSLCALLLEVAGITLGLGHGGMERMIAYPIVMWEIAFAAALSRD